MRHTHTDKGTHTGAVATLLPLSAPPWHTYTYTHLVMVREHQQRIASRRHILLAGQKALHQLCSIWHQQVPLGELAQRVDGKHSVPAHIRVPVRHGKVQGTRKAGTAQQWGVAMGWVCGTVCIRAGCRRVPQ